MTKQQKLQQLRSTKQKQITTLNKEREKVQQALLCLDSRLLSAHKEYATIDRALAQLDGRHQVLKPKQQRAQRDRGSTCNSSRSQKAKKPTVEELLALIKQIPEERRKAFIASAYAATTPTATTTT